MPGNRKPIFLWTEGLAPETGKSRGGVRPIVTQWLWLVASRIWLLFLFSLLSLGCHSPVGVETPST